MPGAYQFLTDWANQKRLPRIISCNFDLDRPVSEHPTEKDVKVYFVTLTSDQAPSTKEVIVYVKKGYRDNIGFVHKGPLGGEKYDELSSVIKESSELKKIDVKLVINTSSLAPFSEKKKFSNDHCLLDIAFIGEKR